MSDSFKSEFTDDDIAWVNQIEQQYYRNINDQCREMSERDRHRSIEDRRSPDPDFADDINSEDIRWASQIERQYRETTVSPRSIQRSNESNIIGEEQEAHLSLVSYIHTCSYIIKSIKPYVII